MGFRKSFGARRLHCNKYVPQTLRFWRCGRRETAARRLAACGGCAARRQRRPARARWTAPRPVRRADAGGPGFTAGTLCPANAHVASLRARLSLRAGPQLARRRSARASIAAARLGLCRTNRHLPARPITPYAAACESRRRHRPRLGIRESRRGAAVARLTARGMGLRLPALRVCAEPMRGAFTPHPARSLRPGPRKGSLSSGGEAPGRIFVNPGGALPSLA